MEAVRSYLKGGQSLRKIAGDFGVPYVTLWFWAKRYREGGIDNLKRHKVQKMRISRAIELKVMYLKEQNPSLSINTARHLLRKQGIVMSQRGIWQIWRRYRITRWAFQQPTNPFCETTPESDRVISQTKHALQRGDMRTAANLLNRLPSMPDDPVIKQIPETYLSPRRRFDRLLLRLEDISAREFQHKMGQMARLLESRGFMYSSISASFWELFALDWLGRPDEKIPVLNQLSKKMQGIKSTALWFLFYREQATAHCHLLNMDKALHYTRKCRRLMYALPSLHYHEGFGALLTMLGKYKEASIYYKMLLANEKDKDTAARFALRTTHIGYSIAGEYHKATKMLVRAETSKDKPLLSTAYYLNKAYIALGYGNLHAASNYFRTALQKASRIEFNNLIYATSVGLAGVAMALNRRSEARKYLKKYLPLMKKHRSLRDALILRQLLASEEIIPVELHQMPYLRLLYLIVHAQQTMKITDYRKAFSFAQRHRLLGLLHRFIVFFPAAVVHVLEKGKKTGLPQAILEFPVFNLNIPVFHIKFLGSIVVSRNQQYVRIKPSPKQRAFLIHLALRAGAPGRFILLNDLYRNFWRQSRRPGDRLSHLLTHLKKQLRIPSHLLTVSSALREPRLFNRGLYLTTDYDEFETLLTQAHSLERAGEWQFAQADYVKAFSLLRGAPFAKIYDSWSERMRNAVINRAEGEMIHFAKGCLEHNNKERARKILDKLASLIPHSQGRKSMLEEARNSIGDEDKDTRQ